MASNGELGNRPACAACKHQRRKCPRDCVFPPYFPGNNFEEFQLIYSIFGVSNLLKIFKNLETPQDREKAAESIKWEAAMWKDDPVLGPLGAYQRLEREFTAWKLERESAVLKLESEIAALKQQKIIVQQQQISSYDVVTANPGFEGIPAIQKQDQWSYPEAAPSHVFMNQETNNRGKGMAYYESQVTNGQPAAPGECYNGDSSSNIYPLNIVQIMEQQTQTAFQGGYGVFYNGANDQPRCGQRLVRGRGECYNVAPNGSYYDASPFHNGHSQVSGPSQLPQLPYPQNHYLVRQEIGLNNNTTLRHQQQKD